MYKKGVILVMFLIVLSSLSLAFGPGNEPEPIGMKTKGVSKVTHGGSITDDHLPSCSSVNGKSGYCVHSGYVLWGSNGNFDDDFRTVSYDTSDNEGLIVGKKEYDEASYAYSEKNSNVKYDFWKWWSKNTDCKDYGGCNKETWETHQTWVGSFGEMSLAEQTKLESNFGTLESAKTYFENPAFEGVSKPKIIDVVNKEDSTEKAKNIFEDYQAQKEKGVQDVDNYLELTQKTNNVDGWIETYNELKSIKTKSGNQFFTEEKLLSSIGDFGTPENAQKLLSHDDIANYDFAKEAYDASGNNADLVLAVLEHDLGNSENLISILETKGTEGSTTQQETYNQAMEKCGDKCTGTSAVAETSVAGETSEEAEVEKEETWPEIEVVVSSIKWEDLDEDERNKYLGELNEAGYCQLDSCDSADISSLYDQTGQSNIAISYLVLSGGDPSLATLLAQETGNNIDNAQQFMDLAGQDAVYAIELADRSFGSTGLGTWLATYDIVEKGLTDTWKIEGGKLICIKEGGCGEYAPNKGDVFQQPEKPKSKPSAYKKATLTKANIPKNAKTGTALFGTGAACKDCQYWKQDGKYYRYDPKTGEIVEITSDISGYDTLTKSDLPEAKTEIKKDAKAKPNQPTPHELEVKAKVQDVLKDLQARKITHTQASEMIAAIAKEEEEYLKTKSVPYQLRKEVLGILKQNGINGETVPETITGLDLDKIGKDIGVARNEEWTDKEFREAINKRLAELKTAADKDSKLFKDLMEKADSLYWQGDWLEAMGAEAYDILVSGDWAGGHIIGGIAGLAGQLGKYQGLSNLLFPETTQDWLEWSNSEFLLNWADLPGFASREWCGYDEAKRYSEPGKSSAFVSTVSGTYQFVGSIQGEKSNQKFPISCERNPLYEGQSQELVDPNLINLPSVGQAYYNEEDEFICKDDYICKEDSFCYETEFDIEPVKGYFYKITWGVSAPTDEKFTPYIDENGKAVKFNLQLSGSSGTKWAFSRPGAYGESVITLDNGEQDGGTIASYSAENYDRVCIKFHSSHKVYDYENDAVDEICTNFADTVSGTTNYGGTADSVTSRNPDVTTNV